ncbi:MAG: hypothetical protein F4Y63_08010 [Chloroflexi bacterium]|nr:hypothetical protein [Chloroflexota bacterium]MYK62452.1 hypothetical protein [Chloroflexota bacterium]
MNVGWMWQLLLIVGLFGAALGLFVAADRLFPNEYEADHPTSTIIYVEVATEVPESELDSGDE